MLKGIQTAAMVAGLIVCMQFDYYNAITFNQALAAVCVCGAVVCGLQYIINRSESDDA